MASQKPPVALVRSVTLIFSLAAGAEVGAALLPHAATSIAAAASTTNAFSRVDMYVLLLVGSFLSGLPHVPCVQAVKVQTVVLPRAPTIQDTSCSWLSAVAGASPILRPRRMTIARSATAMT